MAAPAPQRHGNSHLYDPKSTQTSPKIGVPEGGEDMMQTFIRHYMTSILTPFSEHVRHLQDASNKLARDLSAAENKGDQTDSRLDGIEQRLAALAASLVQTSHRLDATQADLGKTNEEKAKLEMAHDATRAVLSDLDKRSHSNAMAVQEQWQRIDEANRRLHKAQDGLQEAERQLLERVHPGIAQLNELHDRLNFKQLETSKAHDETKQQADNNSHALRKLMKSYEQQKKEDLDSFHRLQETTRLLESKCGDLDRREQKLNDGLTAAHTDIQHLNAGLEHTNANVHSLRMQHADMSATLKDVSEHVKHVDTHLNAAKRDLTEEAKRSAESIKRLDIRMADNTTDVRALEGGHKRHADQLQELDRRHAHSESRQLQFGEWAESAQRDITGLHTFQKHSTAKLEAHAVQQEMIQARLQMTNKGLEATNAHLSNVKGDLANTSETLAKQGGRVELAHKYFAGISKGFQDTHRSILGGDHGLLPPKTPDHRSPTAPNSMTLPTISGPWTPRVSKSS